nr:MAG TPA: hypothetical protein [Caudoviricetes sp.]
MYIRKVIMKRESNHRFSFLMQKCNKKHYTWQ